MKSGKYKKGIESFIKSVKNYSHKIDHIEHKFFKPLFFELMPQIFTIDFKYFAITFSFNEKIINKLKMMGNPVEKYWDLLNNGENIKWNVEIFPKKKINITSPFQVLFNIYVKKNNLQRLSQVVLDDLIEIRGILGLKNYYCQSIKSYLYFGAYV